jgi:hypothetical protein
MHVIYALKAFSPPASLGSEYTIGKQRNKSKREGRDGGAIVAVSADVGGGGMVP